MTDQIPEGRVPLVRTKVYVVEEDIYESRFIAGVYSSLEAAKASVEKVKEWTESDGSWHNGLDFGDCAYVIEFEVEP